ncbi:MAG: hypothetical protein EXR90_04790 [Methyloglobulus sp.]|nr:hypothetical protein [Methyloglobulus sp.]
MKQTNCLWVFALMVFTSTCWAYGGGSSSSKACDKPKFTNFVPAENAEVTAGTAFSFTTSKNTYPTTIKVTVKGEAATVKVDKKSDSTFAVSGKLPASAKGGFARIAINADAQSNCKGSGGWLVKVAE